jgi:TolA-binding protein
MKHGLPIFFALALASSAFAEDAKTVEDKPVDPKITELQTQVKQLQDQVEQANRIIGAMQRQRNQALDQAVIAETQPKTPAAPAK